MMIRGGRRYYFLFQIWSFFLSLHWVVFFLTFFYFPFVLPQFRTEGFFLKKLICIYIVWQSWNLVQLGVHLGLNCIYMVH